MAINCCGLQILPFYGAIMEGHMLMLITELAPRGSLFDVLANDRDRRLAWTHRWVAALPLCWPLSGAAHCCDITIHMVLTARMLQICSVNPGFA